MEKLKSFSSSPEPSPGFSDSKEALHAVGRCMLGRQAALISQYAPINQMRLLTMAEYTGFPTTGLGVGMYLVLWGE